jgi:lipid II:glycine glycyltransferase (peptidoglycan interpeptide bridge formation enzyme)
MNARFASQDEIDIWDSLTALNPNGGNIFQVKAFAQIKGNHHWTPRFILVENIYISVLERTVSPIGKFWYSPKGPGIYNVQDLKNILPGLKKLAKENGVFALRLEPELIDNSSNKSELINLGLVNTAGIQAANTIIIDINKPIEDVLAGFTSKTRYNIRQAEKASLEFKIVPANDENCELFYKLMSDAVAGRSFLRPYLYHKDIWQKYEKSGAGFFMFAYKNEIPQAADFIMLSGINAARKDAGSEREHSIRGATALLEVEVIKKLQSLGIKNYDLYGSPPSNRIKDSTHPYYGFGAFKSGFNENVTDYVGCEDLIIKPLAYKYWTKFGERLAHRQHRKKYGDRYY